MEDLNNKKVLIIQTAFIGDVILATSLVETLKIAFPSVEIHFLVRKGNESLLHNNPIVSKTLIWDKQRGKYLNLFNLIGNVRSKKYDITINIQRFFTTGLLTALSGSKYNIGFSKNPFAFLFWKKKAHQIEEGVHEIYRNQKLIEDFTDSEPAHPKLYTDEHASKIEQYQNGKYICMAPSSVWFSKQFPETKWVQLVQLLDPGITIYLIGGPGDRPMCDRIVSASERKDIHNLAGKMDFLSSAALMKGAEMNYVNDSAPLHMASAVNAPVTAIFCSTIPEFGFGPLSDNARVIQVSSKLSCRPCGLHGKDHCPEGHFKCGFDIELKSLLY